MSKGIWDEVRSFVIRMPKIRMNDMYVLATFLGYSVQRHCRVGADTKNLHFARHKLPAVNNYYRPFKAQCLLRSQPRLKFINPTFCPHSVRDICFMWIAEQRLVRFAGPKLISF